MGDENVEAYDFQGQSRYKKCSQNLVRLIY